jgi:hypothetical protein
MRIPAIEEHGRTVGENKESLFPDAGMYEMDVKFTRPPCGTDFAGSVAAYATGDNRTCRASPGLEKFTPCLHIHNSHQPRFLPPPKSTWRRPLKDTR